MHRIRDPEAASGKEKRAQALLLRQSMSSDPVPCTAGPVPGDSLPPEFDSGSFSYDLPEDRIAQHPLPERSASRLLVLEREGPAGVDRQIRDLPDLLAPGDLLVFNDTRVIPARLHARRRSGGRVEILIERVCADTRALAQLRANRTPAEGEELILGQGERLRLLRREGRFWEIGFPDSGVSRTLARFGHVPLPPYINRPDARADRERYQTVYAEKPGAVAAPTAGLHFDELLLERLRMRGIESAFVTLHVAAGTYRPLDGPDIRTHHMHAEQVTVDRAACDAVAATRKRGGRVVAIGTTAVRSLETAAAGGALRPFSGETRLYLYPGCTFRVVDAMLTNFHLPKSSLLLLVCSFAGKERVLAAYRHAVEAQYRFFSYGDAMLIL